jgi:hypothetical protein
LGLGIAADRQLFPEMVYLILSVTVDMKPDGFIELEEWAAVERGKRLSVQFESHHHDGAGRFSVNPLSDLAIAGNFRDLRILEHAGIEASGRLGLVIESKAPGNPLNQLHAVSPFKIGSDRFSGPADAALVRAMGKTLHCCNGRVVSEAAR